MREVACLTTLLLLAALLATLIAPVCASQAGLAVWPASSGPPGVWVAVYGWGFTGNMSVTIYFDGIVVGSAITDVFGYFRTCVRIPEVAPGRHAMLAEDEKGVVAAVAFNVTAPHLAIKPNSGPAGAVVAISAVGVGPYQCYLLKFDSVVLAPVLFADEHGAIPEFEVIVPSSRPGAHNLTLVNTGWYWLLWHPEVSPRAFLHAPSQGVVARAAFNVTAGAATSEDVERLQAEVVELKDVLANLGKDVEKLSSALTDLADKLSAEVLRFDEEVRALEVKLNSEVARLSNGLADLSSELDGLGAELAELISGVKGLEGSLARLSEGLAELSTRLADESARLSMQLAAVDSRLSDLVARLDREVGDLGARLDVLNSEVASVSERVEEVSSSSIGLAAGCAAVAIAALGLSAVAIKRKP